jgi:hypothetical protein
MTDEDPRLRQLDQIYDQDGRLKEPDAQILLLRQSQDESVWVLMPTHAYVEAHTGRYRNYCGAALGLTFLGCLIHWLVTKPADLGGYVITTAFVALAAALALKIWNSAMRAGIVVTVGRRLQVSITAVKLLVHPMLGERLGLSRSKDGRLWQLHHIQPTRTRLRFMVAHDAFPTLPQFLRDTVKESLVDLDAPPQSGPQS